MALHLSFKAWTARSSFETLFGGITSAERELKDNLASLAFTLMFGDVTNGPRNVFEE